MPKPKLQATTTVAVTQTVKLSPQARKMLLERVEEHARLAKQVQEIQGTKKNPGRMRRIKEEIQELFIKEKQGKALVDGTEFEGHRIKLVTGTSSKFDKLGFMKKHGLTQADFDEFTEYKDNDPYIKITAPGEPEDE